MGKDKISEMNTKELELAIKKEELEIRYEELLNRHKTKEETEEKERQKRKEEYTEKRERKQKEREDLLPVNLLPLFDPTDISNSLYLVEKHIDDLIKRTFSNRDEIYELLNIASDVKTTLSRLFNEIGYKSSSTTTIPPNSKSEINTINMSTSLSNMIEINYLRKRHFSISDKLDDFIGHLFSVLTDNSIVDENHALVKEVIEDFKNQIEDIDKITTSIMKDEIIFLRIDHIENITLPTITNNMKKYSENSSTYINLEKYRDKFEKLIEKLKTI